MRSPEYPDLPWMPPRSWTNANRTSVQLVVIHTTEGSARASAAEDGAAYDQRRTDGTSTHYFHDCDSTVQCVRTEDQAHAARAQGNRRGIQHELCTRAGSANWADTYHTDMLHLAARQAARDAKKWGIPVRKLTPAQVAAGSKGFCGHADITAAFPQDQGTHTDPGKAFPWDRFLDMVRDEMEDGMPTAEEIADAVWNRMFTRPDGPDGHGNTKTSAGAYQCYNDKVTNDAANRVIATLIPVIKGMDVDEDAIAAAVLAGLPPVVLGDAVIAALKTLPAETAAETVDQIRSAFAD